MPHLGVKLRRKKLALGVFHRGDRAVCRRRSNDEPLGYLGDRIAVAHPHRLLVGCAVEQLRCASSRDVGMPVLALVGVADLSAQRDGHDLLAIAEAEYGHAQFEHLRVN